MHAVAALALLLWFAFPISAPSQSLPDRPLGFFALRSQSPLQQLRFGLQHHTTYPASAGNWEVQLQHTWKNLWLHNANLYRIDAEVHELLLRTGVGVGGHLELAAEFPMRYVSGGVLDAAIERFHESFGFGHAARNLYPRNEYVIEIFQKDRGQWLRLREKPGWHYGNVVLSGTWALAAAQHEGLRTAITSSVKLPTGTPNSFFGARQALDAGLSAGVSRRFNTVHVYLNSGVVYFGENSHLGLELRRWHFSYQLALEYHERLSRHSWIAQLLAESGVAYNYAELSRHSWELLAGYKYRYSSGVILEVAVLENLFYFNNSPDIGLYLSLAKTF